MNGHFPKGSGNKKSQLPPSMQGKTLRFPVNFPLKAMMDATIEDDVNKARLVDVFHQLDIKYLYSDKKISSKGKYVSFTYKIRVMNKAQFEKLYTMLRGVEGLKYAL
jgi:putative lipoic acid-binding regulatory protein